MWTEAETEAGRSLPCAVAAVGATAVTGSTVAIAADVSAGTGLGSDTIKACSGRAGGLAEHSGGGT